MVVHRGRGYAKPLRFVDYLGWCVIKRMSFVVLGPVAWQLPALSLAEGISRGRACKICCISLRPRLLPSTSPDEGVEPNPEGAQQLQSKRLSFPRLAPRQRVTPSLCRDSPSKLC